MAIGQHKLRRMEQETDVVVARIVVGECMTTNENIYSPHHV